MGASLGKGANRMAIAAMANVVQCECANGATERRGLATHCRSPAAALCSPCVLYWLAVDKEELQAMQKKFKEIAQRQGNPSVINRYAGLRARAEPPAALSEEAYAALWLVFVVTPDADSSRHAETQSSI